jgi:hypothetical protein
MSAILCFRSVAASVTLPASVVIKTTINKVFILPMMAPQYA